MDVLAVENLQALGDIIADPSVRKLLHDAVQDLMILRTATGASPKNVFDVRYAAGFCGRPSTLSLGNLVREFTGIELAKTETRTNWLQRPLTPEQLAYALDDVRYLHTICEGELAHLAQSPVLNWLMDDLKRFDDPGMYQEPELLTRFYKTKGIGRMRGSELAVAWELVSWRDAAARERNLPREFILPEKVLVALVKIRPRNAAQVFLAEGMPPKIARRFGDDIVSAVLRGLSTENENLPAPKDAPDDLFVDPERIEAALVLVREAAPQKGIDPVLVGTRAQVACFLRKEQERRMVSPLSRGWRFEQFGTQLETM